MKLRIRSRNRRLLEDALDQHLQFGRALGGDVLPLDGPPRHEPLPVGGQRADAGLQAVGDDQHLVVGEQRGDLLLVGLKLVEGALDGGVLVGRVLEFDDAERQAVDEDDHVGPAVVLVLDDGELVDRQPVVVGGVVEVHQPDLVAGDGAVFPP